MKLTDAQRRFLWEHNRETGHRKMIVGGWWPRSDFIDRLSIRGLITAHYAPISGALLSTTITPAGRAALEAEKERGR